MKDLRTRLLVVAAFAACATACGPTIPIVAGLKEAGADIFFGRPAPSPAPIPLNLPIEPVFPPPILPIPEVMPTIQLRCPTASPLAFPAHEAAETPPGPPKAGTYEYRYKGQILKNPGTSAQVTQLAIQTYGARIVSNVVPNASNGSYTFDVTEKLGLITQMNSYEVFPQSVAASTLPAGVNPDNGIYLTAMQSATLAQTFRPVTPIELMSLPATNGPMTLRGTGTDGNTTMTITPNNQGPAEIYANAPTPVPTPTPADTTNSYNAGRVTIDACGTVLQGWKVLLTGTIETAAGAGPNQKFSIEQDYGTQYGGLSLHDFVQFDWTDAQSQAPMEEQLEATIDQEPKLAG